MFLRFHEEVNTDGLSYAHGHHLNLSPISQHLAVHSFDFLEAFCPQAFLMPKRLMTAIFRILLVEDDVRISAALTELLSAISGVEVVMCATTEQVAIDWLSTHPGGWNLAVVDLALGDGSGLRVLGACRVRAAGQKMVVLSNLLTTEMRRRCASFGADAAFDKASEIEKVLAFCQHAAKVTLRS